MRSGSAAKEAATGLDGAVGEFRLPGAPPGLRKPSTWEEGVSTVARPCTAKGRMGGEVAARTGPGSRFAAFAYKECSCQRMQRQIQTIWAAAKLPTAPLFAPPVSPLA